MVLIFFTAQTTSCAALNQADILTKNDLYVFGTFVRPGRFCVVSLFMLVTNLNRLC